MPFPFTGGTGTYYIGYNAFNKIQAAVAAVAAGGTNFVANGTYSLSTTLPVAKPLTLTENGQTYCYP